MAGVICSRCWRAGCWVGDGRRKLGTDFAQTIQARPWAASFFPVTPLTDTLRRLWAVDSFAYSLRVFIALSSIMAGCWVLDEMDHVMPLLLGTIACAIAETDDSWRGRLW